MTLNEMLFSALFENSSIGIVILDQNTDIVSANEWMFKFFKAKSDSYIGKKFGNIFGCAYIVEEGKICGSADKCDVCELRNGVLYVLREDAIIKDEVVSHDFLINNSIIEKWFRISASPINHNDKKNILITFVDLTDISLIEKSLKENEIKYNLLFENMSQGFALHEIITDSNNNPIDYKFLDINNAFEKLTGLRRETVIGECVRHIMPNTEKYWIDTYGKVALTGVSCQFENYSAELGKYFDVWAFSPQKGQFATIISDVTERIKIKEELAESETKFKSYYNNAPDGIFVVDKTGNYIDVNIAAVEMTGYSKKELLSMSILDITPPDSHAEGLKGFKKLLRTGKMYSQLPYITKDKEIRIWDIDAVKISTNRFIGFSKDITEKIENEEKLKYAFYHDAMTGLYNRQYVFDNLESIDKEGNLPLTIISADINGLRSINESFGFVVGDEIIKKVANAINNTCKQSDTAIRWGDDDFLILLPQISEEGSQDFIKKLKLNFEKQLTDELSNITVSIGCFTKNNNKISFKQAMKNVNENLMQNKAISSESVQNTPINMILHTLHEKNKREEMHSKRVSKICVAIGKEMQFSNEDINKLRIIGLVHDIGKIGIDESILNKPAKLSTRECEIMKQHSEIGFRILSANKQTSELAFYVLSHHERLDGTGYPNGIKCKDISLFTRILCVADAFDAMTRKRTYCEGISNEEAIKELLKFSGTQFDDDIVEVLVNKVLKNSPDFHMLDNAISDIYSTVYE